MICVHCAFLKYKKNTRYEIKELSEKCNEIINNVDVIIAESQMSKTLLKELICEYESNKINLEDKINNFFVIVLRFVNEKKIQIIEKLETIYKINYEKILEKTDFLNERIEHGKEYKGKIFSILYGNLNNINEIINEYYINLKNYSESIDLVNFEIDQINFSNEEENKIFKILSNLSDLKIKNRFIEMHGNNKSLSAKKKENNYIYGSNYKNKNIHNIYKDVIVIKNDFKNFGKFKIF